MSIANMLTIARIALMPLYLLLLCRSGVESNSYLWASLIVFFVVAISDALDGYLARRFNEVTSFGAILDPIGDKLILWSSFIVFAYYGRVPTWLAALVIGKDFLVVCGGIALFALKCDYSPKPNVWGKSSAAINFFLVISTLTSIGFGLFEHPTSARFFWGYWLIAGLLTIISGVSYAVIGAGRVKQRARSI